MKRKRIYAGLMAGWLAGAGALQADVLVGWHTPDVNGTSPVNDATPDTSAAGVSGVIAGGRFAETNEGSTDGSYGTVPIPGSPATANRIRVRTNGGDNVITLSITNNTGSDLQLDGLVFDYGRFLTSPTTATVVYLSGDLADADATPMGSPIALAENGNVGNSDFPDYAADLAAGLGDSTLANGESATFRLTFTDAASGTNAGALDNIALVGSTVGAPSGTVPRVAFDEHATGAATDASLDAVTIAGAWTLNTGRSAATYTINNDAGNKALELDAPGSGAWLGTVPMGGSLNPWVATDRLLRVTFSNAQVQVDFAGVTGSAAVLNGATEITSMTVLSNGSNSGNRGIYLDDINRPTPPPGEMGPVPQLVWHSGSLLPDAAAAGLDAAVSFDGSGSISGSHGSTDGSYGIYNTNAPVTGGAFALADGVALVIAITNHTGGRVLLEDLRLDFNRRSADAPADVTVGYDGGDLDDAAILLGGLSSQAVIASDLADFRDLDLELRRKLFDLTLDDGESAIFRIAVSNATGSGLSYVDNIAINAALTNYVTGPVTPPTVATVRKPNVVVFYADDLGVGDVSISGFATTEVVTPNIDALAAQGMRFTDAHTAFATCAPSRYGILAGSMPFRGERFNGTFRLEQSPQFKAGQKSLGHLFQAAGYRTAHIGKTHLGGELYNSSTNRVSGNNLSTVDWLLGIADGPTGYLGFDYSFISHDGVQGPQYIYHENDFPVTGFAYDTNTRTWSWSPATTQPYVFLQAGSPSNPGTGDIDLDPDSNGVDSEFLYDSGSQFIYYGYGDFDTTKTGEIYLQAAKNFITDHVANHPAEPFYLHYASQAVHIPHTPDTTFFDDPIKFQEKTPHLDMVREMDLQLKLLLDHLAAEGVIDQTMVIFTSDNGGITKSLNEPNQNDPGDTVQHDGSGPFRGNKTQPWEGGTLVPFIIRWGDGTAAGSVVPPGVVCEQVISQMDLYPTFATLLDLPQPDDQARDGINVLPYFLGQTTTPLRDHLLAAASFNNAYRFSYRLGGWKIITAGPQSNTNGDLLNHAVVEMYHYASDPYETTDLFNDPAYSDIQARIYDSLIARVHGSTRSTPALDADGDGLFDAWERKVAGNLTTYDAGLLTSTADGDGDGINDGDEYRLRLNPAVPDEEDATVDGQVQGNAVRLRWSSRPGRFYDIEERTNLVAGSWSPRFGSYPGTGGALAVDIPALNPRGFFRVVVEP